MSFSPVPSPVKLRWQFSADSLETACLSNKHWKKVGVEVSYPVTADIFENPENDWLATASIQGSWLVLTVNIKKLSADERAQFRAAQDKEMDQWIRIDVISVCQTWKVAEDTVETKAKARLVVKGFTDPDLTEIRLESPTLSRFSRQLIFTALCAAWFSLEEG